MGRRAVIITSVPKNRTRIRRATRDGLNPGIESAIESYLQSAVTDNSANDPSGPPKR